MTITIRLFATLRQNRGKTLELELPAGAAIEQALKELGIAECDAAILLRNGRHAQLTDRLQAGDTLSIFPPVGGG